MDNLEQQCEDVLFELCDARERYPSHCADELEKCIKLKSDIHVMGIFNMLNVFNNFIFHEFVHYVLQTMKIFEKSNIIDKLPLECLGNFNINVNKSKICFKHLDHKLKNIINTLDNLKAVMDQIEQEQICLTDKLLKG